VEFVGDASDGQICPETITRTYRATDLCGNTADCTQIITVDDDVPPMITCPMDVTVECLPDVPAPDPSQVTATDNCPGDVTVEFVGDASDGQTCPETITRTYRATDLCGNTSDCTQLIVVDDTIPPTVNCPLGEGETLEIDCDTEYPFVVTADDNCDEMPDISCSAVFDPPGSGTLQPVAGMPGMFTIELFGPGPSQVTITCVATDDCGNDSEPCSFIVHCQDELIGCRVTGGGNQNIKGGNMYTFGGQAGAPTGEQPQPWGEWTHHQKRGPDDSFIFHAGTASAPPGTEIDFIECCDPGYCEQARPAPAKQINFGGVGTFKNNHGFEPPDGSDAIPGETYHWFEVHIEDLGEPGGSNGQGHQDPPPAFCPPEGYNCAIADCDCPDYYRITIYRAFDPMTEMPNTTDLIYEVSEYVRGGNLQIHPPVGSPPPGLGPELGANDSSDDLVTGAPGWHEGLPGDALDSIDLGGDQGHGAGDGFGGSGAGSLEGDQISGDESGSGDDAGDALVFVNNGLVAPATRDGLFEVDGDYVQTAQGVLQIEIGGLRPVLGYDVLAVSGEALLNGVLRLECVEEFLPLVGDRFEILEAASVTGSFSQVEASGLQSGQRVEVSYGAQTVTVEVSPAPGSGDLNGDGLVNHEDLVTIIDDLGGDSSTGDLNGDGLVGAMDAIILLQHWSLGQE
jgi:hypothetical protein